MKHAKLHHYFQSGIAYLNFVSCNVGTNLKHRRTIGILIAVIFNVNFSYLSYIFYIFIHNRKSHHTSD